MNEDSTNEIFTCGCHCHASGNRVLMAMLVICGIGGIGVGIACLVWLATPEIGIGPFAKFDVGGLTQSFLAIRRAAFLTIGLGMITTLIAVVSGRRDAGMKKCEK